MSDVKILHRPTWQFVDDDWQMIVAGKIVAVLIPAPPDALFPDGSWLSIIVANGQDYSDHGWCNVDFDSLDDGRYCLEQWWLHLCRGEGFRR